MHNSYVITHVYRLLLVLVEQWLADVPTDCIALVGVVLIVLLRRAQK